MAFSLLPRRASYHQNTKIPTVQFLDTRSDAYLRRLLVSAAQYILGTFGADSALRLQGLKMAAEGTGKAKKRAVVAVARKLAVLLLTLWKRLEPSLCWCRDAGRRQ